MRSHPDDPGIVLFDHIAEARIYQPNWLSRRFNPSIPKAGVHGSAKLDAFCASIDYERDGLNEVFNRNSSEILHSISTIYKKGEIDFIYFDKLIPRSGGGDHLMRSKKAFHVEGLHQFYGRWSEIFKWYGDYIRPAFGSEFGLRMTERTYSAINLHTDHKRYDKIACTALGEGMPSTEVLAESGEVLNFGDNKTVFTKRGCVHTSPVSLKKRVIISANPLEKDPFTGLVLGFGH